MEHPIEVYLNLASSPESREMIRRRERAKHNEASALANARRKEWARTQKNNVRNMYQEGFTIEIIVKALGLSVDDVKKFLSRK